MVLSELVSVDRVRCSLDPSVTFPLLTARSLSASKFSNLSLVSLAILLTLSIVSFIRSRVSRVSSAVVDRLLASCASKSSPSDARMLPMFVFTLCTSAKNVAMRSSPADVVVVPIVDVVVPIVPVVVVVPISTSPVSSRHPPVSVSPSYTFAPPPTLARRSFIVLDRRPTTRTRVDRSPASRAPGARARVGRTSRITHHQSSSDKRTADEGGCEEDGMRWEGDAMGWDGMRCDETTEVRDAAGV